MATFIASLLSLIIGGGIGFALFRYVIRQKYKQAIKEAEIEAEAIKKNKLLEVKEKFINKKAELEEKES